MNAIGVKTFINKFSADHEVAEGVVGCKNMGRGESLVLGEAPDMELVNGEGTADLELVSLVVRIGMKRADFFEIVLHIFDTDTEWNTL
jgi:hypothetical protein